MLDVIIVGSGPAGLMTGITLAENDISVVILERMSRPNENKLCAGYIPISSFRKYGLPLNLYKHLVEGFRFHDSSGKNILVEFDNVVGGNVDRTEFAEFLAKRFRKNGGWIRTEEYVFDFDERNSYVTVKTSKETYKGKFLVLACGIASNLPGKIRGRLFRNMVGLCLQTSIPSNHINIDFKKENWIFYGEKYSPFGYGWIFPKENIVEIGLGSLLSEVKNGLDSYLSNLLNIVGVEKKYSRRYFPVPLSGPIEKIYSRRVFLAGDAAGHVSPITGEGIKYSLNAGVDLGISISLYFKKKISLHDIGKKYLKLLRKNVFPDLKWGRIFLKLVQKKLISSSKTFVDKKKLRAVAELYASNITHLNAGLKFLKTFFL